MVMTDRMCPYCGVATLAGCRVQCGSDTCKRAHAAKRQRDFQREYRKRTGTHYNYSMPSRPPRKSNTHCVDCGAPVGWGKTQETRCRKCGQRRNAQRRAEEHRAKRFADAKARLAEYTSRPARARRDLDRAAEGVPSNPRWPFAAGHCQRCGEYFVCRITKVVPRFCSIQCARLDSKATRRAKQAGVKLTPARRWKVYERDAWVCQLCMRPINRVVPAPHPMSASIDHRVPLDAGGDHSEDNWQTAHFICNSIKSNKILEEVTA